MLQWLNSYLTGRQMSVKIGDAISEPFDASSGVPQGSHLGLVIFLLFLNDVHSVLKCLKLSFADDFKLYAAIRSASDAEVLQQQLATFSCWCCDNRMTLNVSKCSVISFSRKRNTLHFNYQLQGTLLQRSTLVKDLGVMLDSKLTFNEHNEFVCRKASKTLGFLFRITKEFKDIRCLKVLYCSLVRSSLEYSAVIWSPYYANHINRLEKLQRKFVRYALRHLPWNNPFTLPPYEDRCKLIGLEKSSVRRDVAKALFVSDLINSNIDSPELLQQLNFNIQRRNLRSYNFFKVTHARINYAFHEPVSSILRTFNNCSNVFDFNLSRASLKLKFSRALSDLGH